jgi:hypothetical protein
MQRIRILYLALPVLAIVACSSQPVAPLVGQVTEYGVYDRGVERVYADPSSASGQARGSTGYRLKTTTQTVPLVPGTSFGFCYRITGYTAWTPPKVVVETEHPAFSRPGATPVTREDFVRQLKPVDGVLSDCSGYGFDHPYELVPGSWKFTVVVDGKPVLTQSFVAQ